MRLRALNRWRKFYNEENILAVKSLFNNYEVWSSTLHIWLEARLVHIIHARRSPAQQYNPSLLLVIQRTWIMPLSFLFATRNWMGIMFPFGDRLCQYPRFKGHSNIYRLIISGWSHQFSWDFTIRLVCNITVIEAVKLNDSLGSFQDTSLQKLWNTHTCDYCMSVDDKLHFQILSGSRLPLSNPTHCPLNQFEENTSIGCKPSNLCGIPAI